MKELTWDGNKYLLANQYTPLYIYYNELYSTLTLVGSLAWYLKGNNLSLSKSEFEKTIHELSNKLDTDLYSAAVVSVEVGRLFNVDCPVKEFQDNLLTLRYFERNMNRNTLSYYRYTRNLKEDVTLKIYDVTLNARNKHMTIVPSDTKLKIEIKFHKLSRQFKRAISVKELIRDEEILCKIYSEMKHHYQNIERRKIVVLPDSPSSEDLILAGLLESESDPMNRIRELIARSSLGKTARYKRKTLIQSKIDLMTIENPKYSLDL